jgi:hypothetical protein
MYSEARADQIFALSSSRDKAAQLKSPARDLTKHASQFPYLFGRRNPSIATAELTKILGIINAVYATSNWYASCP